MRPRERGHPPRQASASIEAVSGQDMFDKRSNTVPLLGRLATAVVATGEPVWYTGDTRDHGPAGRRRGAGVRRRGALEDRGRRAAQGTARRSTNPTGEQPRGHRGADRRADRRQPPADGLVQRVEVVCRHSSTALANAWSITSLFLMPVWRAIGKRRWVVEARQLAQDDHRSPSASCWSLLILMSSGRPISSCTAKGTLEPVERRDVFADATARSIEVLVKHGDTVKKGQVLAKIRNTELDSADRRGASAS